MTLSSLGWSDEFARSFDALGHDALIPARIARQDRNHYVVLDGRRALTAHVVGRLLYADESLPAVGDWVAIDAFDDEEAVIHAVLPRRSAFTRKEAGAVTREQVLVANVDLAFLVSGLDFDFNLRRIERYLVQASAGGATPVIVLNKADLCDDVELRVAEVSRVAPSVEVVVVSAVTGFGSARLRTFLRPGMTVVFLGSSGVGKSSLANRLLGEDRQEVQPVRADDSRGRHTTSFRELIVLPGGGILVDTPGLRELQLWGDGSDLESAFPEIEALARGCRYRDCSHEVEPGCEVLLAVEECRLDVDRYASYLKLRRELQYLDRRKDEVGIIEDKRRHRQFGRLRSRINRNNPKR